jgi:branched-chain amino acid aminotransferase
MTAAKSSWMNGRLVPWAESTLHVSTEAVLRGASVFEGIAAYRSDRSDGSDEGLSLFRVDDHLERLFDTSMRFLRMALPYGPEDLTRAICELLVANDIDDDAHIRVVVYFDEMRLGHERETGAGVFVLAGPRYGFSDTPMRVTLSPWRRLSDVSMPPRVKASANYMNSRIAIVDAQGKDRDSAIMLNDRGKVSEGPSMNLFLVRGDVLATPRISDGILEGITRHTVMDLARQAGIAVEEREVDATELFVADELFFCGTAYEVTPIVDLDGYQIGDGTPGPITERLKQAYFDVVRGKESAPSNWRTSVASVLARG